MAKYLIEGGNKLSGEIKISGNKNSVLPCLAATLLTKDEVILRNVPEIADVSTMIDILQQLGAEVSTGDHMVRVRAENIRTHILPKDLTQKLRASVLLAGPLLARLGKVEFSHPGGDVIGKRSIETHLNGFKSLGFKVDISDRDYFVRGQIDYKRCEYFMNEASCTAAENLILVAAFFESEVTLKNCPEEPQIVDLCNLLNKMGAKIEGIGTSKLKINGSKKLKGVSFAVSQDYIEMGTYIVAAAITGGEIKFADLDLTNLEPVINPLLKMDISLRNEGPFLVASAKEIKAISKLTTNIWPGFPTDLMSVMIVLATQAKGASLFHDWMYESRMFFVDKLISMGANITIADPHRVLVYGPTKLHARELETPDIRAGMALVLAGLIAQGTSVINKAELIERGYEDVVGNLTKLGAKIQKVE